MFDSCTVKIMLFLLIVWEMWLCNDFVGIRLSGPAKKRLAVLGRKFEKRFFFETVPRRLVSQTNKGPNVDSSRMIQKISTFFVKEEILIKT